jgi:hypothetical protein
MALLHRLSVLALFTLGAAQLELDFNYTLDGLQLVNESIFLNQYPACIGPNISGPRLLLQLPIKLDNNGETAYRGPTPQLSYSWANSSGQLELPCVHDSVCAGSRKFFRCAHQSLSAGCSSILMRGLDCMWIDVTGLERSSVLRLELFNRSYAATLDLEQVRRAPELSKVVAKSVTVMVLCHLAIILLPYVVFRER